MLYLGENPSAKTRVNVLKKVKVNGAWKLCPVVVEPSGKLKDKVRINGRTEVHTEGIYYIEWRENQQRRRQAVLNRHEVLEQARLKALELDAKKAGIEVAASSPSIRATPPVLSHALPARPISFEQNGISSAVGVIFQSIQSYLQEVVDHVVESHLARLGLAATETTSRPLPALTSAPADLAQERTQQPSPPKTPQPDESKVLIANAIEAYLKNIEPPQRERKTYDEYRLVLHIFRDTCGKKYLHEIDRDDCLAFMRHLYSLGNEARTVYNRISVVQLLLKLNGITGLLQSRDKPKWVANLRKMYEPQDLEALFSTKILAIEVAAGEYPAATLNSCGDGPSAGFLVNS